MNQKLFVVLILIAFLSIPAVLIAENIPVMGSITYLKGTCQVRVQNGELEEVMLDQELFAGSTLRTLADSEAEIMLADGNVIYLSEEAEITLNGYSFREQKFTQIGLLFGTMRLLVKKLSGSSSEIDVNTVTTTAGIRGTDLEASVREDGSVLINVDEGAVETETNGDVHRIEAPNASVFSLIGPREDFKGRIEPAQWRAAAIERIRENPDLFLSKLLERERRIIKGLREGQRNIEEYRKEWEEFLRKIRSLESRGRYEEERRLIEFQIARTKKGIILLLAARKQLTVIRSILVLAARIERDLPAQRLPTIEKLRQEYVRITAIIKKIDETERKLLRVLFVLNRKHEQIIQKGSG